MKRNKLTTIDKLFLNDVLNKYYLNNVFAASKLQRIKINLNVEEFLEQIGLDSLEKKDDTFKFKLFLIFFLIFSFDPLLKVKILSKNKNAGNRNSSNLEKFFFKSIIIKRSQIFDFLSTVFLEDALNLKDNLFAVETSKLEGQKKTSFIQKRYIKVKILSDFTYFFSSDFISVDLKEFQLPITFYFKKCDQKIALTNFFPFWFIE